MGSASRRWALNLVIHTYGDELRDEVSRGLPAIVKLVLEAVELRPGDHVRVAAMNGLELTVTAEE